MNEKIKLDWMINGLLAVIVVLLACHYVGSSSKSAMADGGGWETSGVMIGSTQTPQERLVLVDTKKQSIMVYRRAPGRWIRIERRAEITNTTLKCWIPARPNFPAAAMAGPTCKP